MQILRGNRSCCALLATAGLALAGAVELARVSGTERNMSMGHDQPGLVRILILASMGTKSRPEITSIVHRHVLQLSPMSLDLARRYGTLCKKNASITKLETPNDTEQGSIENDGDKSVLRKRAREPEAIDESVTAFGRCCPRKLKRTSARWARRDIVPIWNAGQG